MINLLPPATKVDMLYARKNSVLLKWTFTLVIALLGVGLIVASGMFYLTQTTRNYEKNTEAARQSLQAQKIDETQKTVDEISNDIKLATQVLSREILFSKLLLQLGSVLPANTSLQQLQIDDLKGGITLSAGAKDIDSATQIQLNLADPKNKIFEKADIEHINCGAAETAANNNPSATPGADVQKYPCIVQIRALFTKDNPFLYISPSSAQGSQKQ